MALALYILLQGLFKIHPLFVSPMTDTFLNQFTQVSPSSLPALSTSHHLPPSPSLVLNHHTSPDFCLSPHYVADTTPRVLQAPSHHRVLAAVVGIMDSRPILQMTKLKLREEQ